MERLTACCFGFMLFIVPVINEDILETHGNSYDRQTMLQEKASTAKTEFSVISSSLFIRYPLQTPANTVQENAKYGNQDHQQEQFSEASTTDVYSVTMSTATVFYQAKSLTFHPVDQHKSLSPSSWLLYKSTTTDLEGLPRSAVVLLHKLSDGPYLQGAVQLNLKPSTHSTNLMITMSNSYTDKEQQSFHFGLEKTSYAKTHLELSDLNTVMSSTHESVTPLLSTKKMFTTSSPPTTILNPALKSVPQQTILKSQNSAKSQHVLLPTVQNSIDKKLMNSQVKSSVINTEIKNSIIFTSLYHPLYSIPTLQEKTGDSIESSYHIPRVKNDGSVSNSVVNSFAHLKEEKNVQISSFSIAYIKSSPMNVFTQQTERKQMDTLTYRKVDVVYSTALNHTTDALVAESTKGSSLVYTESSGYFSFMNKIESSLPKEFSQRTFSTGLEKYGNTPTNSEGNITSSGLKDTTFMLNDIGTSKYKNKNDVISISALIKTTESSKMVNEEPIISSFDTNVEEVFPRSDFTGIFTPMLKSVRLQVQTDYTTESYFSLTSVGAIRVDLFSSINNVRSLLTETSKKSYFASYGSNLRSFNTPNYDESMQVAKYTGMRSSSNMNNVMSLLLAYKPALKNLNEINERYVTFSTKTEALQSESPTVDSFITTESRSEIQNHLPISSYFDKGESNIEQQLGTGYSFTELFPADQNIISSVKIFYNPTDSNAITSNFKSEHMDLYPYSMVNDLELVSQTVSHPDLLQKDHSITNKRILNYDEPLQGSEYTGLSSSTNINGVRSFILPNTPNLQTSNELNQKYVMLLTQTNIPTTKALGHIINQVMTATPFVDVSASLQQIKGLSFSISSPSIDESLNHIKNQQEMSSSGEVLNQSLKETTKTYNDVSNIVSASQPQHIQYSSNHAFNTEHSMPSHAKKHTDSSRAKYISNTQYAANTETDVSFITNGMNSEASTYQLTSSFFEQSENKVEQLHNTENSVMDLFPVEQKVESTFNSTDPYSYTSFKSSQESVAIYPSFTMTDLKLTSRLSITEHNIVSLEKKYLSSITNVRNSPSMYGESLQTTEYIGISYTSSVNDIESFILTNTPTLLTFKEQSQRHPNVFTKADRFQSEPFRSEIDVFTGLRITKSWHQELHQVTETNPVVYVSESSQGYKYPEYFSSEDTSELVQQINDFSGILDSSSQETNYTQKDSSNNTINIKFLQKTENNPNVPSRVEFDGSMSKQEHFKKNSVDSITDTGIYTMGFTPTNHDPEKTSSSMKQDYATLLRNQGFDFSSYQQFAAYSSNNERSVLLQSISTISDKYIQSITHTLKRTVSVSTENTNIPNRNTVTVNSQSLEILSYSTRQNEIVSSRVWSKPQFNYHDHSTQHATKMQNANYVTTLSTSSKPLEKISNATTISNENYSIVAKLQDDLQEGTTDESLFQSLRIVTNSKNENINSQNNKVYYSRFVMSDSVIKKELFMSKDFIFISGSYDKYTDDFTQTYSTKRLLTRHSKYLETQSKQEQKPLKNVLLSSSDSLFSTSSISFRDIIKIAESVLGSIQPLSTQAILQSSFANTQSSIISETKMSIAEYQTQSEYRTPVFYTTAKSESMLLEDTPYTQIYFSNIVSTPLNNLKLNINATPTQVSNVFQSLLISNSEGNVKTHSTVNISDSDINHSSARSLRNEQYQSSPVSKSHVNHAMKYDSAYKAMKSDTAVTSPSRMGPIDTESQIVTLSRTLEPLNASSTFNQGQDVPPSSITLNLKELESSLMPTETLQHVSHDNQFGETNYGAKVSTMSSNANDLFPSDTTGLQGYEITASFFQISQQSSLYDREMTTPASNRNRPHSSPFSSFNPDYPIRTDESIMQSLSQLEMETHTVADTELNKGDNTMNDIYSFVMGSSESKSAIKSHISLVQSPIIKSERFHGLTSLAMTDNSENKRIDGTNAISFSQSVLDTGLVKENNVTFNQRYKTEISGGRTDRPLQSDMLYETHLQSTSSYEYNLDTDLQSINQHITNSFSLSVEQIIEVQDPTGSTLQTSESPPYHESIWKASDIMTKKNNRKLISSILKEPKYLDNFYSTMRLITTKVKDLRISYGSSDIKSSEIYLSHFGEFKQVFAQDVSVLTSYNEESVSSKYININSQLSDDEDSDDMVYTSTGPVKEKLSLFKTESMSQTTNTDFYAISIMANQDTKSMLLIPNYSTSLKDKNVQTDMKGDIGIPSKLQSSNLGIKSSGRAEIDMKDTQTIPLVKSLYASSASDEVIRASFRYQIELQSSTGAEKVTSTDLFFGDSQIHSRLLITSFLLNTEASYTKLPRNTVIADEVLSTASSVTDVAEFISTVNGQSLSVMTTNTLLTETSTQNDTTANFSTALTVYQKTTTEVPRRCFCPCKQVSAISKNAAEVKAFAVKVMQEIKVNKTKLSSQIRKKISAYDGRTSAKIMGTIAGIVIVSIVVLLIINDIHSFIIRIRNNKVRPVKSKKLYKFDDIESQN